MQLFIFPHYTTAVSSKKIFCGNRWELIIHLHQKVAFTKFLTNKCTLRSALEITEYSGILSPRFFRKKIRQINVLLNKERELI